MGIFDRYKQKSSPTYEERIRGSGLLTMIQEAREKWTRCMASLLLEEDIELGGGSGLAALFLTGQTVEEFGLGRTPEIKAQLLQNGRWLSLADYDLKQIWLAGSDLRFIQFIDLDLRGATLFASDLTGSTFERCDLRNTSFSDANLSYVEMRGCDLRGTQFNGADTWQVDILWQTNNKVNKTHDDGWHFDHSKKRPECICMSNPVEKYVPGGGYHERQAAIHREGHAYASHLIENLKRSLDPHIYENAKNYLEPRIS